MANPQVPLTSAVTHLAEKIRKYREKSIGEQNTKASLVEPLLECLGWDIRDLDSVHREYRTKTRDNPVDYALKLLRLPRLFIEAKGLGENISDRKWISQVLGYAAVAGVEWCVLTDGNEYRIYNAAATVDAEEKLFRKVRVADDDAMAVSAMLNLISRSNLEENLLDVHWKAHFVDRRVKAAIVELVEAPHPALIRLIRKKVPNLPAKAITGSLARLDVKIESPPLPIAHVRAGRPDETPKARRREQKKKKAPGTTSKEIDISLTQLIAAGILKAPLALFQTYMGRQVNAMLLTDGSIQHNGKSYNSPSKAGAAAKGTVTGSPKSTNGWSFWLYEDGDVKRELSFARERYLKACDGTRSLRISG